MWLFLLIILVNMFCVTAAIAAVCAGLIKGLVPHSSLSINLWVVAILVITSCVLILGGYKMLDGFIKLLSLILLISVLIVFVALLLKGPVHTFSPSEQESVFEGAGLALLVSLLGWMPAGMEASVMHSIWVIKKKENNSSISTKEVLFDFKIGYILTTLLALVFLSIGAYAVYGSGQKLEGNSVAFTNALIQIFTGQLGQWSKLIFFLTAFATIYGTLIVVIDAFGRCLVESIALLRAKAQSHDNSLPWAIALISSGAALLFYFFKTDMITMLEMATTLAFICTPILAWLNFMAISTVEKPTAARKVFCLFSLLVLSAFALYYISSSLLS